MGRYAAKVEKKNPFSIFYSPEFRKFQMIVIGVLVAAATAGLLPATVSVWVLLIVSVLTSVGVYKVPNKPTEVYVQPLGTPLEKADVVVNTPEPKVDTIIRGDVKG
jgi:uncharacterized membrane protein